MPQVFIYTDESNNGQRPNYTRYYTRCCRKFAGKYHSQTYGLVAWHWMNQIKTWQIRVGLWMTKASSCQDGKHYQKHHMHRKNRIAAPVEGLVSRTIVHAKNTTFCVQIYATVKDNVKRDLFKFMSHDFC